MNKEGGRSQNRVTKSTRCTSEHSGNVSLTTSGRSLHVLALNVFIPCVLDREVFSKGGHSWKLLKSNTSVTLEVAEGPTPVDLHAESGPGPAGWHMAGRGR